MVQIQFPTRGEIHPPIREGGAFTPAPSPPLPGTLTLPLHCFLNEPASGPERGISLRGAGGADGRLGLRAPGVRTRKTADKPHSLETIGVASGETAPLSDGYAQALNQDRR